MLVLSLHVVGPQVLCHPRHEVDALVGLVYLGIIHKGIFSGALSHASDVAKVTPVFIEQMARLIHSAAYDEVIVECHQRISFGQCLLPVVQPHHPEVVQQLAQRHVDGVFHPVNVQHADGA